MRLSDGTSDWSARVTTCTRTQILPERGWWSFREELFSSAQNYNPQSQKNIIQEHMNCTGRRVLTIVQFIYTSIPTQRKIFHTNSGIWGAPNLIQSSYFHILLWLPAVSVSNLPKRRKIWGKTIKENNHSCNFGALKQHRAASGTRTPPWLHTHRIQCASMLYFLFLSASHSHRRKQLHMAQTGMISS